MGAKTRKLSQINDSLIEWQSVVVADGSTGLTAVAGRGYFINTTGGAITVTTPASSKQGDKIVIVDYAGTFATNNVTINFNGAKIFGASNTATLGTNYQAVDLIFIDNTQGWRTVNQDTTSDIQSIEFISATGGTLLTSGDFKTHVFTGDGCFVVSAAGNSAGSNSVEYLVVAGGGAGTRSAAGGGGAGGYRQNYPSPVSTGLPVSVSTYPITVGGGGAAGVPGGPGNNVTKGTNSIFSTITSAGGGTSGDGSPPNGQNGGSGAGTGDTNPVNAGSGNTPPVSPPQGNNGGIAAPFRPSPLAATAGGGGGAGATGSNAPSQSQSGAGGDGSPIATDFFGPTAPSYGTPGPAPGRYFAGGGGGGSYVDASGAAGGSGGGGAGGGPPSEGTSGTSNTGGGGGGGRHPGGAENKGGAGGSGIVVIRYKFQ